MKAAAEARALGALADAEARRRISEDLSKTLLVEAAAGTGKTTCLVQRMVALVASGAARIEQISAVTFTLRAAAQLSQKFQNALEDRRRGEGNPETRARLDAALGALDAAFLGTIHAFCARLLRERPVEAGVDPGFREMDEPEDHVERDAAWERFVQRLFVEDSPALARLASLGLRAGDLKDAFEEMVENSDVEPAVGPEIPEPDLSEARRRLEEFLRNVAPQLPREPAPTGWTPFEQAVRRAIRLASLNDLSRATELVRVLRGLRSGKAREKAPRALRIALEAFQHEVVRPALRRWAEYVHPLVLPILVEARDSYRAWRRRNGRLNFQDLLIEARDMLRDRPDVRRALRRRFTPILVDEFQDTDPIQAEILLYLTGEDSDERDWRKLSPAPGSLFVVGDPKQSIYRFRRADIETYQLVRRRIEESGGSVVELSTNFRSTPALCEWINGAFGRPEFFPAEATPKQPSYVPLTARRPPVPGPHVLRIGVRGSGGRNETTLIDDAERIGRFIASSITRGEREPGDFLILFRRRRSMGAYARVLERLGIPYEIAGGGAFAESRELGSLLPVLRALADPDDPVAFVASLRGPIFGIDDDALYRFVRAGGRFRFTSDPPREADPRIVRAIALFREGARLVETLPAGAAISRTCALLGVTALAAAEDLGDSRAGNLLKSLAAARRLTADGLAFPSVVRELERLSKEDLIEQMSVEPGRPGVVRLMTLHGAKGLEARVVFLADPTWEGGPARSYFIDREANPPAGYFRVVQRFGDFGEQEIAVPPDWESRCAVEQEFDDAEKIRLLYVGATRAKDLLVVSVRRSSTGKLGGPWAAFDRFLPADLELAGPPETPAAAPLPSLAGELEAFRAVRATRVGAAAAPSHRIASVTSIVHEGEKPAWETTGRGMSWGRVLHAALEARMRDPATDLRTLAANLLAEEERPETEVDEVVRVVEGVARSPLWARALGARRRLVEVPFAIPADPSELGLIGGPERTLLTGAVDLAFEEEDGWTLVDYKSDTVAAGAMDGLVAFYRPQVALYRTYWQRLTGRPTRAGLFFLHTGETVWLDPTG